MSLKAPLLCALLLGSASLSNAQDSAQSRQAALISAPGASFIAPGVKSAATVIVYGDQRFTDPKNINVTNPKVRRWLVQQIAQEKPDAILLNGDVPYSGDVVNDYEVY